MNSEVEYLEERSKARQRDIATKYRNEIISKHIDAAIAVLSNGECARAYAEVAQAMIAYNRMIDERWSK